MDTMAGSTRTLQKLYGKTTERSLMGVQMRDFLPKERGIAAVGLVTQIRRSLKLRLTPPRS